MENSRKKELQDKLTSGFFGFWVKNTKLSFLLTFVLIALGIAAIISIPKESSPAVDLGMVTVTTVYPWANPQDVDTLITDKIYNAIENIDGVDSIESTSSLGVSSIYVNVKTNADVNDVRSDIQAKVKTVSLPSDAREPSVNTLETNTNRLFALYIYKKDGSANLDDLLERAKVLKSQLKEITQIKDVIITFSPATTSLQTSSDVSSYDATIAVSNEALEAYGLTLSQISQTISAYNQNRPIGNFSIGDKNYDFRIDGKNTTAKEFLDIPITLPNGGTIHLSDIATIKREYLSKSSADIFVPSADGKTFDRYNSVALMLEKSDNASIFEAASVAKKQISEFFKEQGFSDYGFFYSSDIADIITKDYVSLAQNGLSTLALVFVSILFFVGIVDSIFATLVLPLAFLGTFILLNQGGYTMNMLTNFSLIISLGIAIDTVIVFVQAAGVKMKLGYNPQTAIILALKEYAVSIIVGTSTTIAVFIPIMSLPGLMGRFLAFIPVTIFGVLTCWLIFAFTINTTLYQKIIHPRKTFVENKELLEYVTADERELLMLERQWKKEITEYDISRRARIIDSFVMKYRNMMQKFLSKKIFRKVAIWAPIAFLGIGTMVFAPMINFELFPADDNNIITYTLNWPVGYTTEKMKQTVGDIAPIFANFPEIQNIIAVTTNNSTFININLYPKEERKAKGQRDAFAIEKALDSKINYLKSRWLDVVSAVQSYWPPTNGDVGINIEAESASQLQELIAVAKDFESYITSLPGTKNIKNSSSDTPGQFVFTINKDFASLKWVSPSLIIQKISEKTNGLKVGSIDDNGMDMDVMLKDDRFLDDVSADMILDIPITVGKTKYRIGDFVTVNVSNSVSSISQKDGTIRITINADAKEWVNTIGLTREIQQYAQSYNFPKGIYFSMGWAQSDNSELITAMLTALFLSVMVIFGMLTWQFNSYKQSFLVFYSVIMAFPFVLFGLIVTGNPYSLMFGIGIISFMGVAVNHGIILIEAINQNLAKGMGSYMALIEATSSRLEPMILTTITTVLGMLPIAMSGRMWAGLGYTIVFGLIATTFITLFSLSSLYYDRVLAPQKPNIFKQIFRKFVQKRNVKNLRKNYHEDVEKILPEKTLD